MQRSSTTSGTQNLRTPSKNEVLYLENSLREKRKTWRLILHLSPLWSLIPIRHARLTSNLKDDHDAIFCSRHKRVQDKGVQFFQTLSGCVSCCNNVSPECLNILFQKNKTGQDRDVHEDQRSICAYTSVVETGRRLVEKKQIRLSF